ncbi:diguanylate cyclase domain-containing protein [Paraburkholderia sp. CNPSo 3272]|uniref:diguanylate cyclase domain-containing protein n=1 Tax=Paraburkholderia sp. CNPSo 3272 TaxID=2940931 RepID=UPI0020B68CAC|nr:diguanylate cyclase [Paraburkholderia sp. CNPSo 3272]
MIVEDDYERKVASQIAASITSGLEVPINVHGSEYSIRASLGVAVLQPGDRAADVVKAADRAMYVAKERSRANSLPSMPGEVAA